MSDITASSCLLVRRATAEASRCGSASRTCSSESRWTTSRRRAGGIFPTDSPGMSGSAASSWSTRNEGRTASSCSGESCASCSSVSRGASVCSCTSPSDASDASSSADAPPPPAAPEVSSAARPSGPTSDSSFVEGIRPQSARRCSSGSAANSSFPIVSIARSALGPSRLAIWSGRMERTAVRIWPGVRRDMDAGPSSGSSSSTWPRVRRGRAALSCGSLSTWSTDASWSARSAPTCAGPISPRMPSRWRAPR
mmetsp:Transcript_13781/g.43595  ORF Transcript_13781/g.43595 Transcript_13781/m.43595 type:complete len:253 (-) Transcript_13781:3440-4198(-)